MQLSSKILIGITTIYVIAFSLQIAAGSLWLFSLDEVIDDDVLSYGMSVWNVRMKNTSAGVVVEDKVVSLSDYLRDINACNASLGTVEAMQASYVATIVFLVAGCLIVAASLTKLQFCASHYSLMTPSVLALVANSLEHGLVMRLYHLKNCDGLKDPLADTWKVSDGIIVGTFVFVFIGVICALKCMAVDKVKSSSRYQEIP